MLTPPPRRPWWRLYLAKFDDPVIRVLLIAAGLAVAVGAADGKAAEGVGILAAVFLATFLAFWNEHRAGREFDILNRSNDDVPVKAVRDHVYKTVPRRDVVAGDLLMVEVGEEVPADGLLLEAVSLLVDEAKLTGESRPAAKEAGPAGAGAAYGKGQLLRGTVVVDGYGLFEVSAVGDRTEIGRTLRESTVEAKGLAPLKRQLADLSRVIGVAGFGIALLTFAALVGRSALSGGLAGLPAGEWVFAAALGAGVAAALAQVWLPVAGDAWDLLLKMRNSLRSRRDTGLPFSSPPLSKGGLGGVLAGTEATGAGQARTPPTHPKTGGGGRRPSRPAPFFSPPLGGGVLGGHRGDRTRSGKNPPNPP